MAAMICFFRLVEIKVRTIQVLFLCIREGLLYHIEQGTLIAFEAQNVVASLFNNMVGDLFLATHGIRCSYA